MGVMRVIKYSFLLIALFVGYLCGGGVGYAQTLSRGTGVFTYTGYAPFANRPVDVHYHIPTAGDVRTMPVVFVLEGADRGFGYLIDAWKKEAEERRFIVAVLHFDLQLYPLTDYQETGVMSKDRTVVREPSQQTSALIDQIFLYFREQTGTKAKTYNIYGHSAGGQFIQRFMLFYDSPYVGRAIIGSPGWYTMPDTTQLFPYGEKNVPYIRKEALRKYLAKDIVLQLGMADTIRESFLRKTPEADAQGRDRLERGRIFYNALLKMAHENNWPCNWQKVEVPHVGHNSVEMGQKSLPVMFGDSIRALFMGNSYTFFNDMPQMVRSLALSNGSKLAVKQVEHGGWRLRQHAADSVSVAAIAEGGWDFVVFQEQSQEPSYGREWVTENNIPAISALNKYRRLFNPAGRTVFYMTWGHNIDTYETMQQGIAETYLDLTSRFGAWCAPVGMAWKRVRTERPDITLYIEDRSHPTLEGSYLAANVFYSVFSGMPYSSVYTAGLPAETAAYLQRIAQEVVFANAGLWNIRPVPQPQPVSERFYNGPAKRLDAPTLRKPKEEGFASLYEINCFLKELADKHPDKVQVSSIGTTPGQRDIPVLYFGTSKNNTNKVKVWIQAGLHGNEPAGPEAICLLTNYLLNTAEGQLILMHTEIALVPVANPDGYAFQSRRSGGNLDLNRDQSKLADPVSVLLKQAYTAWNPEVALDIHEFTPWRKDYDTYFKKQVAIFDDVLFLPTGHPNVSPVLREFSDNVLQKRAEQALGANGFTSSFYFTPQFKGEELYLQKGARSPQSSSTSFALSNALSMFIEIRGLGLERVSFARRAEAGFTVAGNLLQTCCMYKKQIKSTVARAIAETKKGHKDIVVTSQPKTISYPVRFVDFQRNDTFSVVLPAWDGQYSEPVLTRRRPAAYVLADTCHNAVRILEALGVKATKTTQPLSMKVEQYTVTSYTKATTPWENIYPVKAEATTQEITREFPAGSYLVDLKQKNANHAVTLLEPESDNAFVAFNVIQAAVGQVLPVYRLRK